MIPATDVSKYLELFGRLASLAGSECEISLRSCNLIAETLNVMACSILLPNPLEKTFYLGAARQISRKDWPEVCPSMDSGPLADVYKSRQPLLINGKKVFENHFGRPHNDRYCLPSCILTPLLKDNRCLGIINIAHPGNGNPFTPMEGNLLESSAVLISNALIRSSYHHGRIEAQRTHQADDLKYSVLSIISHELRTPLAVISGAVPMISPDSGTAIKPKLLRQLHSLLSKNCDRLNEVVTNILDVTEIENGTLELDLQILDIHEVLEGVMGPLRPESSKKKLCWKLDLDAPFPKIRADPKRMHQVFRELVSNAIKFSSDGESVDIKTRADMGRVVVEFTNYGEVIEKSDGKIIFEKFFQCDQSSTRKHGGVGLGLFLAKNLINMQKGDIELRGSGHGGTTFMVSFPLQSGT